MKGNYFSFFKHWSLDAALGMVAASFFVLNGQKDTPDSPTVRERPLARYQNLLVYFALKN